MSCVYIRQIEKYESYNITVDDVGVAQVEREVTLFETDRSKSKVNSIGQI